MRKLLCKGKSSCFVQQVVTTNNSESKEHSQLQLKHQAPTCWVCAHYLSDSCSICCCCSSCCRSAPVTVPSALTALQQQLPSHSCLNYNWSFTCLTLSVSVSDMITITSAPPLTAVFIMAIMPYTLALSAAVTAIMTLTSDSVFNTVA